MTVLDYNLLKPDSYTFVSQAHNTVSWLDHVVTAGTGKDLIENMCILQGYITSDHLPILCQYNITCENVCVSYSSDSSSTKRINWSSLGSMQLASYCNNSQTLLGNIHQDRELLCCTDTRCKSQSHLNALDKLYNQIVSTLYTSSSHLLPEGESGPNSKYKTIPGWNDYVKEAHEQAREAFILWQINNKPRNGPICDLMKTTRAQFKRSLRYCKANEDRTCADALAKRLLSRNNVDFWKYVYKMNKTGRVKDANCGQACYYGHPDIFIFFRAVLHYLLKN